MPSGGLAVLPDFASCHKVVGVKQSTKAVRGGRAAQVFLARDADPALLTALEALCAQQNVPVERGCAMAQLGQMAGISVGAAVVALLRD